MAQVAKITGVSGVLKNLKISESAASRGAEKGLKRGGLLIMVDSQKEVPVDKGILRESAFTRKSFGVGFSADIVVGYTAAYAPYVHENLDAAHGDEYNEKYAKEIAAGWMHNRGSGQKAKFLEDPAKRDAPLVTKMVQQSITREMTKAIK